MSHDTRRGSERPNGREGADGTRESLGHGHADSDSKRAGTGGAEPHACGTVSVETPASRSSELPTSVVLEQLATLKEGTTVVRLARSVAAALENEESVEAVSPRQTRAVYARLQSGLLEELSRQGQLEYCDRLGTVRVTSKE